MRTILELCVAMDELAQDSYAATAESCDDPDLKGILERVSADESDHVTWWKDLIYAWDQGLVPDVVNDTEGLERHVHNLFADMQKTTPSSFEDISDTTMLEISARFEFLLLDPIFGELLDLTEPGGATKHREAYARHLERVVGAIDMFHGSEDMARFLSRVLRRGWRDNLALAAFATRDPLSGLHNRRGLMAQLDHWMSWAGRYDRPLGTLLVDVDDFKKVNDTYGHGVGDELLTAIAGRLRGALSEQDLIARYGGEEFVFLLVDTDPKRGLVVCERLRRAVADTPIHTVAGMLRVTISIGLAPLDSSADVAQAIDQADQALLKAKEEGKNRVVLAGHAKD